MDHPLELGHPLDEDLGLLGKFGRGDWPPIFGAELARSAKENIKHRHGSETRRVRLTLFSKANCAKQHSVC